MATIDFDAWADTYDRTRAGSDRVVRLLLDALGESGGRALLDIGCGTGNFTAPLASAGFRVIGCDVSAAMARRAHGKLAGASPVLVADAQRLPFADASFDVAVCVNVIRHVPRRLDAFAEAHRVLRDGPLVLKVSTAETLLADWLPEYFPTIRVHQPRYQREDEIMDELRSAGFTRVTVRRFAYEDADDGSYQALKRFPERLLDDVAVRNTAVFMRLPSDELRAGLERVRRDHASGALRDVMRRYDARAREFGDGALFTAQR